MNLPTTRAEAKALGSTWYDTGKPCKHGHQSIRFTSVGICKECARVAAMSGYVHTTTKRRQYDDLEGFVLAATAKHAGRYTYAGAVYLGAHAKIQIQCSLHGAFWQKPTNHMSGKGCPACRSVATGLRSIGSTAKFVQAAEALLGARWGYNEVQYVDSHTPVRLVCPEHGVFLQTPTNHLSKKVGCTKCNHMKSGPEEAIAQYLSTFTQVESRNRTLIKPKELDIYLPEKALAIEYCGEFWHSHFNAEEERADKKKHVNKHLACAAQGIRLLTIYETEWKERPQALRRLLRNAIGKGRGRLMARKCALAKVDVPTARAFYEKYHPQGGAGSGEHYGLFWSGKLVACMRFSYGNNDRGHGAQARVWTLSRYATRVTVAGAASRLMKAFVTEHNTPEIKSFSDNRYFSGAMYRQLGFVLEADVAPDYQVWSPKDGMRPKSHYQRRLLPKRLAEHGVVDSFDPATDPRTEADMTYLMKCGRIYDCGKKKWLWTAPQSDITEPSGNPEHQTGQTDAMQTGAP